MLCITAKIGTQCPRTLRRECLDHLVIFGEATMGLPPKVHVCGQDFSLRSGERRLPRAFERSIRQLQRDLNRIRCQADVEPT